MTSNNKLNLLEGNIKKTLIKLAIPMMYGIIAIMLFNIVDTIYIGHLGTKELAAIGFTYPVVFLIMSLTMGMGIGATSVISRAIGKGKNGHIKRLTTDSLILSLVMVVIIAFIGLLSINPIFRLLGATPEMILLIRQYMVTWYLGVGFLVIPMVGNSAIRATGDTKTPSLIMITAGVINIILDPFLIFGLWIFPKMGLKGAALATVISFMVTFTAAIWILVKRENMIDFHLPSFKILFNSWKKILYIGIPAAATNMLIPLSTGILIKIISNYGTEAIAAFGVSIRIESLSLIGIIAMSTALMPFVGQNYGARKNKRILTAISLSKKYSIIWGLGVAILLALLSYPIAILFSNNPIVIKIIRNFLFIVPISYGLYGITLLMGSAFNAVNKPIHSTILIIIRIFVFAIPFALIGSKFYELTGIFIGICLANILIGIISIYWGRKFLFKNMGNILRI